MLRTRVCISRASQAPLKLSTAPPARPRPCVHHTLHCQQIRHYSSPIKDWFRAKKLQIKQEFNIPNTDEQKEDEAEVEAVNEKAPVNEATTIGTAAAHEIHEMRSNYAKFAKILANPRASESQLVVAVDGLVGLATSTKRALNVNSCALFSLIQAYIGAISTKRIDLANHIVLVQA